MGMGGLAFPGGGPRWKGRRQPRPCAAGGTWEGQADEVSVGLVWRDGVAPVTQPAPCPLPG